jgi:hypothetical protein
MPQGDLAVLTLGAAVAAPHQALPFVHAQRSRAV